MYKINKIVKEVREENLFESGIKLPKGTRAVKLLFH